MSLVNAFDAGTCAVAFVDTDASTVLWSGNLTKGQSSPEVTSPENDIMQASVTADGDAQLFWISGAGGSPKLGYSLEVIPAYSVSNAAMQISSINMPFGESGSAQAYPSPDLTATTLTGSDASWTPDPVNFSANAANSLLGLYESAPH